MTERLSDRIEGWQAADKNAEAPPQSILPRIAEILSAAKNDAERILGKTIDPEVTDLPAGVLADCHSGTGATRLDAGAVPDYDAYMTGKPVVAPDKNMIAHALVHEGTHRARFQKSLLDLPIAVEEGLTEHRTALLRGTSPIAYQQYIAETRAMAQRVGVSMNDMSEDLVAGRIEQIQTALRADELGMTFVDFRNLQAANDDRERAAA